MGTIYIFFHTSLQTLTDNESSPNCSYGQSRCEEESEFCWWNESQQRCEYISVVDGNITITRKRRNQDCGVAIEEQRKYGQCQSNLICYQKDKIETGKEKGTCTHRDPASNSRYLVRINTGVN